MKLLAKMFFRLIKIDGVKLVLLMGALNSVKMMISLGIFEKII